MMDLPTEEELAEALYEAVPAKTASSLRQLSWDEVKSLTGFPYPEIVAGHYKEAKAVLDLLMARTRDLPRPTACEAEG